MPTLLAAAVAIDEHAGRIEGIRVEPDLRGAHPDCGIIFRNRDQRR